MTKLLLSVVFVATSLNIVAQSDEKDVAAAVETLRQAMISASQDALNNAVADELSYGHSSGLIEDKKAFVENIVSGKSGFMSITLSDQTVRVVDKTAIVRHKLVAETKVDGKPGSTTLGVLLIWQKQKGQWKLLARQATRLQQ